MARVDEVHSVFIVSLTNLILPVVWAFVFPAGVPVLVVVGVELVAVIVVVGLSRHESLLYESDVEGALGLAGALRHGALEPADVGSFWNLPIVLFSDGLLDGYHVIRSDHRLARGTCCARSGAL